jgi:hypothetical protein
MVSARVLLLGLSVFLFAAGQGFAQEDVKDRLKDILRKKKAGQELTADEKEFLEKNARFFKHPKQLKQKKVGFGEPGGFRPQQPPAAQQLQVLLSRLNVVDRAALSGAQQLWQGKRRDDAVALAEKIVGKTPDADAAGVARLMLGRFLMELERKEEADKHLRAVTGRAAELAMAELAQPLIKANDVTGLLAAFKDLLTSQKNGLDRCRVVKALLDLFDRSMEDGLPPDQRAELLQAVADSIPYEEALAAKEALAKEEPLVPLRPQGFGAGRGPNAGPPIPPEMMERLRAMRELPPDQRNEAMGALMKEMWDRAEKLEAEGRVEEARRLKEMVERHKQMMGRMKEMMMKKGKGRGMMPPRDPGAVRAEIKRLEDQGFMDEANKLRRELEEGKRNQAVNENF